MMILWKRKPHFFPLSFVRNVTDNRAQSAYSLPIKAIRRSVQLHATELRKSSKFWLKLQKSRCFPPIPSCLRWQLCSKYQKTSARKAFPAFHEPLVCQDRRILRAMLRFECSAAQMNRSGTRGAGRKTMADERNELTSAHSMVWMMMIMMKT